MRNIPPVSCLSLDIYIGREYRNIHFVRIEMQQQSRQATIGDLHHLV